MGIAERKEREKEQRLRAILKAARRLFISKGYENTTMLDIAEAAELSRRTLYHYFTSKEEISAILTDESFLAMKEAILTAIAETPGRGFDKLESVQKAFMHFYRTQFEQYTFVLYLDQKLYLTETPDGSARKCLMLLDDIVSALDAAIREGIQDGSVKDIGCGTRQLAATIVTMVQSTMQKLFVRKGWMEASLNVKDDEILDTMFSVFYSSIRP